MKKIVWGLSLAMLVGCGEESIPQEYLKYATERAYCSGLVYASATLTRGSASGELDAANGVSLARYLTLQTKDLELKQSFNKGYKEAKSKIEELQNANKSIDYSSSEFGVNEVQMSSQGSSCVRNLEMTQPLYSKVGSFTDSEMRENWPDDLSTWITSQ